MALSPALVAARLVLWSFLASRHRDQADKRLRWTNCQPNSAPCVPPDPIEPGRCIVFGRERADGFEL